MATGGKTIFSCCSPCLDNGRNITARHYCVDCEMYFCTKCVDCHNSIPATKKHQVNEVNTADSIDTEDDTANLQSDVLSISTQGLRCTIHRGRLIDTFCKDHNEVCCGSCAVVKHRSCTTVAIAVAAKDFKSSSELKKFKDALKANLVQSQQEKEKRTDNLDSIGKQKLELIEDVDKYEEKIIARIKELANISRNEIRSKYQEDKTSLDMDIDALDVVIVTNTECTDTLETTDGDGELFVLLKSNKTVKDGEKLLQAMANDWEKRDIQFIFEDTLEKHVIEMKSLGRFKDLRSLGRLDDYVQTESNEYCNVTCEWCGHEFNKYYNEQFCQMCG